METITQYLTTETSAPAAGRQAHLLNPREGFDIGWCYASYGLVPPAATEAAVQEGFRAGLTHFGPRTPRNDRFVRKYLQLRLSAWHRGRIFDPGLSPEYLNRITPTHCPVTRQELTVATGTGTDWSVDRIINDGGYAPGNLVVMSTRANLAKDSMSYGEILQMTKFPKAQFGLQPIEWARLAAIVGVVSDWDSLLPLLVMPPSRLVIANRFTTLQIATMMIHAKRPDKKALQDLRNACAGKKAKKAMDQYLLAAGRMLHAKCRMPKSWAEVEYAIGDAWLDGTLMSLFRRWMAELPADGLEACRAAARRLDKGIKSVDSNITEAWGLDRQGYATA